MTDHPLPPDIEELLASGGPGDFSDIEALLAGGDTFGDLFAPPPVPWPTEEEIAEEIERQRKLALQRARQARLIARKEAGIVPWTPTELKRRERARKVRDALAAMYGIPFEDFGKYELVYDGSPRRKPSLRLKDGR